MRSMPGHRCRKLPRRGSTQRVLLATSASVLLIVIFLWFLVTPRSPRIFVYGADGVRVPMTRIAAEFARAQQVRVELQFAGSGTLLTGIDMIREGDVLVCADDRYIAQGREKSLLAESVVVATQAPVLAVAKGNPRRITSLSRLHDEEIRIALANPQLDGIGAVVEEALSQTGQWETLQKRVTVLKSSVDTVAEDIRRGAADAGFVWNQTVERYSDDLEIVPLSELEGTVARVSAAVLTSSRQPAAARKFIDYLLSEAGQRSFAESGFGRAAAARVDGAN
jgi:molybdate transport system substrate-binding protein